MVGKKQWRFEICVERKDRTYVEPPVTSTFRPLSSYGIVAVLEAICLFFDRRRAEMQRPSVERLETQTLISVRFEEKEETRKSEVK